MTAEEMDAFWAQFDKRVERAIRDAEEDMVQSWQAAVLNIVRKGREHEA